MADPRFFAKSGPFTLSEIARIAGAEMAGMAKADKKFSDVKPLSAAGSEDVSFIDNRRYLAEFASTRAGAVLTAPENASRAPAGTALLLTKDPYRGYALVAQAFYPPPRYPNSIAATASVAESAHLQDGVGVGPGAVIGERCVVGEGAWIGPNAVLGDGVTVGPHSIIGANCTLTHCDVGARAILHPGVAIGQDGFGFAPGAVHAKVPQLGRVIIGDDVEIGANTTIDRGAGPDTMIGAGTKIDNLVQIGHNVTIGKGCLIVAQVGISGSTRVGDYVMIGGQAGLVGHIVVGDGARIAAQSGVSHDVPAGSTVAGSPAADAREYWKTLAFLNRLRKRESR